jgi:ankyrin repeat protein
MDWAAQEGHCEVVEQLLARDRGLLDLPGYRDRTALAAAAGNGHVSLMERLLGLGADPRRRAQHGMHGLEWAAAMGHREIVERLVVHDPGLVDLPGVEERTALIAAARAGDGGLVELLLAHGADPMRRDIDGETVLDGLVLKEQWAILERLLQREATLWDVPLVLESFAAGADELAPGVRIPRNGRLMDVLIVRRHADMVRGLLERHRSRIDAAGLHGATPLMLCAATCQDELVRWLLENGADAARCDESGDHALLYAIEQRGVECARLLIEHDPRLMYRAGARRRRPVTLVAGMARSNALRELFVAHGACGALT